MSLFNEHLSILDPSFSEPSSESCSRKVREMAEVNWRKYEENIKEEEGTVSLKGDNYGYFF